MFVLIKVATSRTKVSTLLQTDKYVQYCAKLKKFLHYFTLSTAITDNQLLKRKRIHLEHGLYKTFL